MKTPLAALRNAAARVAAGTAAGGAAGAALHTALPATAPLIDGTLNLVDVTGGLAVGGVLGALWAAEAALLGSGLVGDTVRAAGGVFGSEADRAAGDRMLSDVRKSLDRLREVEGVQGQLLRLVLDLSGITSDPGAGHLLNAVRVFGRAMIILSKEQRIFFRVRVGAFSVVHSSAKQSWSFQISLPARGAGEKPISNRIFDSNNLVFFDIFSEIIINL